MNFNRETDHTPPVQPDSSPLASLGHSLQARADWSRRALSPWVQRQLESAQPDRSARARSFTLTRPPVQAMLVGQLQRTSEETFVSRPTIGSVNPLLVENFTQEVAGRHTQQVEPKYQPKTSDAWANAPADLTWSGLTKAEETQVQPPAPTPLPFTVDQVRQAIERQQAGLSPLPITSSPTPAPAPTQTVQPKRETGFPFSVAEVRAALEQPHFAKTPEIKRPSTPPPSSPRQRRWVEEVTPPAAGPATPSAGSLGSFSQPETLPAESPRLPAKAPASPPPVQRQVMPRFEPLRQSAETPDLEPEQSIGFDESEDATSSFTNRLDTALPPIETAAQTSAPVQLKPQPARLPRQPEVESARPAEGNASTQADEPTKFGPPPAQSQRPASAPVQRQMLSRPRPPRSEPVWQTLDPTNLPANRMSEFDRPEAMPLRQPEPEPDEFFLGDKPAQALTPAATGAETAPLSMKPAVQRQPDIETPPPSEASSTLEIPLRLPQSEPDEVAQVVEPSPITPSVSEGEAAQPSNKPTVQRQPAFEAPPQSELPVLAMPLRLPQTEPDEVAQVVEPSPITPSVSEGEAAQPPTNPMVQRQPAFEAPLQPEPSSLEMPLRLPQTEPDVEPSLTDAFVPAGQEAAVPLPGQPTVQHPPLEMPRQREQASPQEMPLRQSESGPDDTITSETATSKTGREVTSPPSQPTVQRQLAFEPQTEQPSSLEMPLRLPEIEPTKIVPPIEPSQATTPGVVESLVPSAFSQPAAQRQPILEPQHQVEPPSTLEIPLRFPQAEPGKAAQNVEPSPASAINQAVPPHQATVQRRSEDETPPYRIESQPRESLQTPDLPLTKMSGEEQRLSFDDPEEMPLRRVETDSARPARQIGVLPQVRQPFEARPEGMPAEPKKTGEPALPLVHPTVAQPEAVTKLDMPLAAPPQPAPRASERGEAPPSSTSIPAMSVQRYWEPEIVSSPSVATDSEIGPIQRVEESGIPVSEEPEPPAAELDLDGLARQVYPLVKRMLAVERDRRPFR